MKNQIQTRALKLLAHEIRGRSNVVMARQELYKGRVLFALLALFSMFTPNQSVASDACGSIDRVIVALRLTKAIYPEIRNRELDVAVGNGYSGPIAWATDARSVMITTAEDSWRPHNKGDLSVEGTSEEQGVDLPFHLRFDFIDYTATFRLVGPTY